MLIRSPYPLSLYSFFREVQWGLTLEEEGRFTVILISVANYVKNMQKLIDLHPCIFQYDQFLGQNTNLSRIAMSNLTLPKLMPLKRTLF